jgi:hypothetical protein
MKLLKIAPIILLLITLISSCTKEESIDTGGTGNPSTGSGALQGTWKFVSITGKDSTVHIYRDAGTELRFEIVANLSSSNPKGSYIFSGNTITAQGVGYDYQSPVTEREYENNVFQSEQIIPLNGTIAPVSGSSQYKLIGTDSMYLDNNMLGGMSSAPGGLKYKIEGSKLSLFVKEIYADSAIDNGVMVIEKINTSVTVVLQKQ